MNEIETLQYFARVAEKLEAIAEELAGMRSSNWETADRLHRFANAIRLDMPVPGDLVDLDCRWDFR
jgi:hypothetical protein